MDLESRMIQDHWYLCSNLCRKRKRRQRDRQTDKSAGGEKSVVD